MNTGSAGQTMSASRCCVPTRRARRLLTSSGSRRRPSKWRQPGPFPLSGPSVDVGDVRPEPTYVSTGIAYELTSRVLAGSVQAEELVRVGEGQAEHVGRRSALIVPAFCRHQTPVVD